MNEKFPEEAMDRDIDLQTKCNVGLIGAGDWLVERGGFSYTIRVKELLSDKESGQRVHKGTEEFLYDYYMERDCKKEANAIWKESDKR